MDYNIVFPDNVTPKQAVEMILKRCKEGYFHYSSYKDGEFYLCSGDCQGCSGRAILEFLSRLHKEAKK